MDPNPIKHPAVLIAYIRDEIEPALTASGFQFTGRNNPRREGDGLWIDYARGDSTFSIRFDLRYKVRLAAETLDGQGGVRAIADVDFETPVRSHADLMERVRPFIDTILQTIATLAP